MFGKAAALSFLTLCLVAPAAAQDGEVETIPFVGGELTITQTPDYEKVLAFDGRELARDYFVFFDRIDTIAGVDVAFVYIGPGGNACSPAVAMVYWQPEEADVRVEIAGEGECATPAPAIGPNEVYFVPWLLPGQSADVKAWVPEQGFRLHGRIGYAPEPETGWADLGGASISHPLDFFRNADVYAAAEALLGDALEEVATGLGTASQPERGADGVWAGTGCVPHACGTSDSFIAVDPAGKALYFAQQGGVGGTRFWPARENWPAAITAVLPASF